MRNKRVFMLMIGLILFIAIIGFSLSDRKELTWPEKVLRDTSGYVQQWFYKPAGYIAGFFEDIRELNELYEENEQLRLTAAAYARDKANYNFIKNENERLKEELNFTEQQKKMFDYNYLIAHVISVSNDANNRTMSINLGSKNGIKPNMAVTTVDGLVGLVSSVTPFTSTIMPITELNESSPTFNSIAVTIEGREDESFGILSSYNKDTGRLVMTKIAENDKMVIGDTVITSGLGGVYPRGIRVGTVETKQVGDFGLTYTATIKLATSFDHLTEVFVVQDPQMEEQAK
ncbi:rod shape-determining protein MreC [Paenibacillus sp. GSMTC-2017]|uniref:rod shape-determining protein MreC n=1 Tax=Paenibacillus sp. GSMTC-2017 TaxID=2794350 RepID=UPI0018D8EB4E|nr:rod shape-determining protein MreC [Paenibacillus sp. GSMTC-2017]MBH5317156.1 rod shape-determining protein MreC [Paenibacillus sp. GSMTC-2017]